jgi:Spy/CpxP family protein refolding chaperone
MKINKFSLIAAMALGALVAGSSIANAQDAKEGKGKGKRGFPSLQERLDRMTEKLKLTDEQKPKVEAVLKETDKKRQALAPEDRRTKGRELMEEQDKKLKEVLTAEQYEKWEKMRDEMRRNRPGGPGGAGGEKKGEEPKKE